MDGVYHILLVLINPNNQLYKVTNIKKKSSLSYLQVLQRMNNLRFSLGFRGPDFPDYRFSRLLIISPYIHEWGDTRSSENHPTKYHEIVFVIVFAQGEFLDDG